MQVRAQLQILLLTGVVSGLVFPTVVAQTNDVSAKEHFERARSYSSSGDARAEDEYKQAIAKRSGVYPEAWEWLSRYLSHQLRFEEATQAWRQYLNQIDRKIPESARRQLERLQRVTFLKSQSDNGQTLTLQEIIELTTLIAGFSSKTDALPYAEKAVQLHPESAKALVMLAEMIGQEQRDRALDLLNRAVALEPSEATTYVARGKFHFWLKGDPNEAAKDFRQAIELSNGANAAAWSGLGDSFARLGRTTEAIAAYRKYLLVRPESAAQYDAEIRKSIEMLKNNSAKP